MSMNFTS